jgi:hypothetical protein
MIVLVIDSKLTKLYNKVKIHIQNAVKKNSRQHIQRESP